MRCSGVLFGVLFAVLCSVSGALIAPASAAAQAGFDDEFGEDDWEAGFEEEQTEAIDETGTDAALTEAEGGDALPPESAEEADDGLVPVEDRYERELRHQSTLLGSTGGFRVEGAEGGPVGSFRYQFGIDFFAKNEYVVPGDEHSRIGGVLSIAGRIHRYLELWGSIRSYATSNTTGRPNLFLVMGDVRAGAKVPFEVAPWLTLAAEIEAYLPTSGELGVDWGAMGASFDALATLDLRGLEDPVPFMTRLALGYRIDNTESFLATIEEQRYAALTDPIMPPRNESRHLATTFERTALGANRTDFFDLRLGIEAPLRVADEFFIQPLLEWSWAIPVNRQGYSCLSAPDDPTQEGCLSDVGVEATAMDLTLGVRVLPPVKGFAAYLGVDIGLTGTAMDKSVRELAMNEPYVVFLGVQYSFDTRPPPEPEIIEREVPVEVEVQDEPPPLGRIHGTVVTQDGGAPIDGAIVNFPASPYSRILAEGGRFTTYGFEPGTTVEMEVVAPEHEPGYCSGTIPGPQPESENEGEGREAGEATDGAPELQAPQAPQASQESQESQAPQESQEPRNYDIEVRCALDQQNLVEIEETEIRILEQINFAFDSAEILESSFELMQQIATVIRHNPQIRRIEIQGHTDNQGSDEYNADLSQRRADSVKAWLVENGVEDARLSAIGYGVTQPIVPNDTDENRARNRRVQFVIVEQDEAPASGETGE